MIIQKRDGGFNYATTDLAAIRYRFQPSPEGDGAHRLIYVTDAGQANHFAGVFQIAKRANWIPDGGRIEHVPFGLVQGEDGKKLKTRSGIADLGVEVIDRGCEGIIVVPSQSKFLVKNRADCLMKSSADFLFGDMLRHLDIKHDLNIFHMEYSLLLP